MGSQSAGLSNPLEALDKAAMDPMLHMGLGILGANRGHYGAAGPAIGGGALAGLQSLSSMREAQALEEYRKAQLQAAQDKQRQHEQMAGMWAGFGNGQIPGGAPGGPPMGEADKLRAMAVQAGMMGNTEQAAKLYDLALKADPGLVTQMELAKRIAEVSTAGPIEYAKSQAQAGFKPIRIGDRYLTEGQVAALARNRDAVKNPFFAPVLFQENQRGDPRATNINRNGTRDGGIGQMNENTLKSYGVSFDQYMAMPPEDQRALAEKHFDTLYQKYNGIPELAWGAYNGGEGMVDAAIQKLYPGKSVADLTEQQVAGVIGALPNRGYVADVRRYQSALDAMETEDPLRVRSEAETAEQVEMAKLGVKGLEAAQAALPKSDAKLGTLQVMDQMLDQIKTGAFRPTLKQIMSWAEGLNISLPGIESLAPAQAFDALTGKMTLDARSVSEGGGMPGAMSDADREFLRKMVPGLEKTKGANRMLLDITRRLVYREKQIAELTVNYANKYETLRPTVDKKTGRRVSLAEAIRHLRENNRIFPDDYVQQMLPQAPAPQTGGF